MTIPLDHFFLYIEIQSGQCARNNNLIVFLEDFP
jgi:hypothetical protein